MLLSRRMRIFAHHLVSQSLIAKPDSRLPVAHCPLPIADCPIPYSPPTIRHSPFAPLKPLCTFWEHDFLGRIILCRKA
jgi:hypothetical protein